MLLSHCGEYTCECKNYIFAVNDTIVQENYWNKWGLTHGYERLRISYEFLRISYQAYDYLTINLPDFLWIPGEC